LTLQAVVVRFPGSNCDEDAHHAAGTLLGAEVRLVSHDTADLGEPDIVILPGGFSYGDYLRCGAMARFTKAMDFVARYAERGGAVLGICNGFQILCEAGLLPGALVQNSGLRFVCKDVHIRVETSRTFLTEGVAPGTVLRMPIAHGDGNWRAPEGAPGGGLDGIVSRDQVVFRYVNAAGERAEGANPNGSLDDVAGLSNERGNVVALMPHPDGGRRAPRWNRRRGALPGRRAKPPLEDRS
jgi:phosphoribosylformylglycinamidine synthase